MEQEADIYVKYYEAQAGGSLPVFRGAKRYNAQSGAGIGDIFRSLFRTVLPVALSGISTFLGETLKARNSGSGTSWKDAAKSALGPSARNVLEGVGSAIQNKLSSRGASQGGSGRHRRKRKRTSTRRKSKRKRFREFPSPPDMPPQSGMGRRRRRRTSGLKKSRRSRTRALAKTDPGMAMMAAGMGGQVAR